MPPSPGAEGELLAPPPGRHPAGEAGYTIIEVMIAMLVLIVGVFGTFVVIEGGLASTSRTTAREQGTNLARDLVERSRQVPYTSVTVTGAGAQLAGTLPATEVSGLSGSTFQVARRNVVYTVTVSTCTIDDPSDGAGKGTAQFCMARSRGGGGSGPPPALAPGSVRMLGIDVSLGGSLLDTVCSAVGTNTEIEGALAAAVSPVAAVGVCRVGSPAAGSAVPVDADPDDMRRVRIDVSWTRAGAGSVSQTTLLPNPSQN